MYDHSGIGWDHWTDKRIFKEIVAFTNEAGDNKAQLEVKR